MFGAVCFWIFSRFTIFNYFTTKPVRIAVFLNDFLRAQLTVDLCNFFVCLGVLCGIKLKSETAKFLMIVMCIAGFVVSGFEHCVANMGIFVTAGFLVPGLSIGAMFKSMVIVTLGNMVGGAVLLAWPLRKMSADQ